jgi:hypothetical protein
MDEYEDNSMSCPSDNKRGWDLFNDYVDCNQSAADDKRACTEWLPLHELGPNSEQSHMMDYDPRAANISPGYNLGYLSPSTTHLRDYPEEIDRIGLPGPCLIDLSWSVSNPIPSEIVLGQNSGEPVVEYQDEVILHEISGNEPDYQEFFNESSGIYPPSDMQGGSLQCTSVQDTSWFGSLNLPVEDIEGLDLAAYPNAGNEPKELPSSQTAFASGFHEKPYDTCLGMVID